MRKASNLKRDITPDPLYRSERVEKFINYIMQGGRKTAARKVVYGALEDVKGQTGENPVDVFETVLKNVGPTVEVRSRRVGGANYQVPREVQPDRRLALAMRWIRESARARKGVPARKALAEELCAAYNNEGEAVKKREQVHKMAEANKAFAHFA